jgi:hypothetical protein
MADNKRIVYTIIIDDKGKVKIENLTNSFESASTAVKTLNQDLITQGNIMEDNSKKNQNMIDKTGLAGATLVELSRTVSDFNYGFRAMANNLSQLSTLFITLIATTGGLSNAMSQLTKAMRGPLGFIVAFQVAIAVIEYFTLNAKKATDEVKKLNEELSKQQGLNENIRVFVEILKDGNSTVEMQTLAMAKLKKEGYDPTVGSLEEFEAALLKVQELELEEIKRNESIEAQLEKRRQKEADLADAKVKHAEADAYYQRTSTQPAIDALEQELSLIDLNITTAQKGFINASKEILNSEEIKGNPFLASLLGLKTTTDDKGVRKPKVKVFDFGDAGELLGRLFQDIEDELEERDKEAKSKKRARLRRLLGLPTDEEQKEELSKFLNSEKERIDLKEEEHQKDLQRIEERKQANERLTQMLVSQIGKLATIQNKAFQGQITRLNTERDIILNNDNLTAKEKNRLLKENDRQSREIKIKQIKFERDMFQIEAAMELAKLTMAANGVLFNIGASATQGTLDATSSIGKFLQQLGPIAGPVAFAAMIGGVIAQISSARKAAEQQIRALSGPLKGVSAGGGGSAPIASPAFNVVGATQESQLAQTISQAEQQPIKAFVVASDVSTAQELERSTIEGASIG